MNAVNNAVNTTRTPHSPRTTSTAGATAAPRPRRLSARLRLTLSYALFAVVAGALALAVIYVAMYKIPNYPLTASNPRDDPYAPTRDEIMNQVVRYSGLALLAVTAIGLAGGWIIAGRVLRPLQEITRAADRAAAGSLEHRIGLTGRRDEFTDLSDTFDHMLGRIQESFEAQRRFAANASHELRTPLSVSRTMLDVAVADPSGQDYGRLVSRLSETNRRGIEIVEALLQLSALNRTELTLEPADLADTATEALGLIREEAAELGITVSAEALPAPVTGNAVLLRQVALNLLQNGLRHNLPTGGGTVTLTTGTAPSGRSTLTVTNTGEQLRPEAVATYAEPFLRGRGRLAATGGSARGHGLGLAIVADIVDAHDGTLDLHPAPGGGLTASITLPELR
ncbi:HAMP domain-containing sensor histidine kinase [Streptomyces sp. NPDC048442]|uniref:sensor histidine kinase n=1 Tax=Streptomyces sp. NPDC048442 TaxID=3154823 RepID=UPI003440267E